MTGTRIKIDLSQGLVEVEGTETFVKSIYEDFKERIKAIPDKDSGPSKRKVKVVVSKAPSVSPRKGRKRKGGTATPTLVKDLDLTGGKTNKSLRDFYKQYVPENNMENNLVFAYYLQHEIDLSPISVDHIFTCYRHIGSLKVPKALPQSLVDTANRKGWLDTNSLSDIKVPISGFNHIEHDMKKSSD